MSRAARRSLPGHVAQREQQLAAVEDEVVVVAAHGAAGLVGAGHLVARHRGGDAGQQALLDLRRHPHVLLQAALLEALLEQADVLDLGRGHVGQRGDDAQVVLPEGRGVQAVSR
jgi:hypothetical protein